jgi:hypothetical protein
MTDPLRRYSPWLYAAAAYNLAWGSATALAPELVARPLHLAQGNLVLWQAVGLLVASYAPVYLWSARRPSEHAHLIVPAFIGKTLGPVGFVWALASGTLPLTFGLTIITNDLIWLPAFGLYLRQAARQRGGLRALLSGAARD